MKRIFPRLLLILCCFCLYLSSELIKLQAKHQETSYTYQIIASYPHDSQAFTQGLVFYEDFLYEGTGLYGQSILRQVSLEDGQIQRQINLPPEVFGEGIAILDDRIIQLTWREQIGYVCDLASFELTDTFHYPTEGWGLTTDGKYLIMSDGSSILTYLDPKNYTVVDQIQVLSNAGPVELLNELEYINDRIYANIWLSDLIVIINPSNGQVTGWIDLTGLLESQLAAGQIVDVLNGIAYDQSQERLFVTGKLWPKIYQIQIEAIID